MAGSIPPAGDVHTTTGAVVSVVPGVVDMEMTLA